MGDREIVSVIGPNGAGKTSIFNVITGVYKPTSGDVRFAGESIAGKRQYAITNLGIARTFQSLRLFLNMSVKENVKAATYGHTKASPPESILRLPRARREEKEVDRLATEKSRKACSPGRASLRLPSRSWGEVNRRERRMKSALSCGSKRRPART